MRGVFHGMVATAMLIVAFPVQAVTGAWTGKITKLEQNSDNRVGDENMAAVWFSGNLNAGTCPDNMVYFNAKDNPHMLSMFMSAYLSDRKISLVADDSKPKWYGYCQAVHVSFAP